MYPFLSDLINDLLGTNLQLPMKTFGFFLALAFMSAFYVLRKDLRRREIAGQFTLRSEKIKVSGPIQMRDVYIFAAVWGFLGYKLGLMFSDPEFFNQHTDQAIFSGKGYWLTGLMGLGIAGALKYREYEKKKDLEEKYETKQVGISHYLGIIVTIAFAAGIVGAKVAAMLEPGSNFWSDPVNQLLSFNGLSFYGGLLLAGFLIIMYIKRKGFHLLTGGDAFAPALILAYAVGRMGCQMSGDGDWGIANTAPKPGWMSFLPDWFWVYDYPNNVASAGVPIPGCEGEYCNHLVPGVFPTPLYEIFMGLAIFGFLWFMRKKFKYAGQLSAVYLVLNGIERFTIEKIRVNDKYEFLGLFETTQAEVISAGLVLAGIALWIYASRHKKILVNEPAAAG